ncbi:class C sortase [Pseudarthrobacter sp. J1738]|uniref:class C sortase n=1 Tax=unclassified Pseudarthrobacter TaxID=2647000 RepID=UPI003D269FEF
MSTTQSAVQETKISLPRSRVPGSAWIIALLVFAGVSVMTYPSAASWFSELQQSKEVRSYDTSVKELGPVGRSAALDDARKYNSTLSGGAIVDPFTNPDASNTTDINAGTPEQVAARQAAKAVAQNYAKQLALSPDGVMSRLVIPSIGVDLPIYHGTGDAELHKGVGHLYGTALPVGGKGTHAVLTGHSGVPEATLFTRLKDLKLGDEFEVSTYGDTLTYRINNIVEVLPTETESLRPVAGKDLVTLITCTPIGINTHRLLVTAERVNTVEQEQKPVTIASSVDPPWWILWIALGLIASVAVIIGSRRR